MAETLPQHWVFLNRPMDLVNSLHCKVVVNSVRGIKVTGGLVAIDPVTDTAVIVDMDNGDERDINKYPVTIVPLVKWETMEVIDSSEAFKVRVRGLNSDDVAKHDMSEEEREATKSKIIAWLAKNGLQSVMNGDDIIIADAVVLEPPYSSDCCSATNEIILARVQALLERMQSV